MKTKTIEHTVLLPGSPKRVYDAYVDAKKHAAFTGARAKIAKRASGRMTAWDGYIDGEMLVLQPGRRIVQTWRTQNWPAGAVESILDIRLKPKGKNTELTMVHSGIPASPASLAKGFRTGWHSHYWVLMRKYLR
jgi:uncharacterized protein YndB with AHSA1/START domain